MNRRGSKAMSNPSREPMLPIPSLKNMKNYLQSLWDNAEPLFAEMTVEGEDFLDTGTIYEAQGAAVL